MKPTKQIRDLVHSLFPYDSFYNDKTSTGRRLKFVCVRTRIPESNLKAIVAVLKMKLHQLGIKYDTVELRLCAEQSYKNRFYHALVVVLKDPAAPTQLQLV